MGKFRGVDVDPGWINRKFAELDRQIREARAERRLAGSTVDAGDSLSILGALRVVGSLMVSGALELTGTLSMKSAEGDELLRMGDQEHGDRGITIRREDGTVAFEVRRLTADPLVAQSIVLYDRDQSVVEVDGLFGGLRKPFFEHPFQPVAAASGVAVTCGLYGWERQTSAASWETLFVYDGKRQNPLLDIKVAAVCSDATTAGEVQVVNLADGDPLPSVAGPPWLGDVPAGSTSYTTLDPAPLDLMSADAALVQDYMRLGVQVRRTAGAGSITLAVAQAIGG